MTTADLNGPGKTDCTLAIDLGTSGPKVALVSVQGEVLACEIEQTPVMLLPGGGAAASATRKRSSGSSTTSSPGLPSYTRNMASVAISGSRHLRPGA